MISSLELAKICGVSQGTVDRALHNRKGVSEKTKNKIIEAAKAHGYQPNPAAREIITGQSNTVAAIAPSVNSVFFMDLMNEIKNALRAEGLRFILAPVEGKEEMLDAIADFSARRSAAIIVIPPEENIAIPDNLTTGTKIISLLSPCKGKNMFFVSPDEEETGRRATEFLADKGRARIMHLTYSRKSCAITARARGYCEEMKRRSLQSLIITTKHLPEIANIVKKEKIDALFCHNDWLALSATRELEKAGARIPEDLSLLGVDNSPSFVALCNDISTMQYPFKWVASQTAKLTQGKKANAPCPEFKIIQRTT